MRQTLTRYWIQVNFRQACQIQKLQTSILGPYVPSPKSIRIFCHSIINYLREQKVVAATSVRLRDVVAILVSGALSMSCGGSLINQRYVLTAAHCVKGEILTEVGQIYSIRLGEYDITKDIDCVDKDCADPPIETGYEEIIAHESFDPSATNRHHDIALIRLNQDVLYTDFITPVCLPSVLNFQRSQTGTSVVVAGWGRTLRASQSSIKQKLTLPVSDPADCGRKFATKNVNIIDSQLCAGGIYTRDTCDGDSGGPLMKIVKNYWIIEGIISFGNRCGLDGWPAVYTRVSSYESWIKRNLRP